MNLKDLYYFYDLSNLQSFTAVARKNGVSQPSISYAIKRLEKEFHCQLLVHDPSHRTFKLTPQGDILLRHVKKALPEIQGAQKEILRSISPYDTIGFPPLIIDYLVRKEPAFIENVSALRNIHPIQEGSIELLDLLSKGELDASFIGSLEPIIDKRFSVKTLMTSDLYYILPSGHSLADKEAIAFSDVLNENFIILDEHFVHLNAFQHLNNQYHHAATPFFQTDDINLLKQLLRKKIGISLLSEIAITKEDKDLISIPMVKEERMSLYVSLVTLKETNLHPEVENFFQELLN
ncbi:MULTISPECIES: LysR family transcriptional regulator [Streptococcus]|jgi:transcriptional regulator, lysR family, putative|uniref:LysR family transcriptional regulator n=1 Tax=Streptococcus TaxID=1301 RepID=UPI0008A55CA1|nr:MULTISPECIES: LysR family transcriptional regulator [Streptococcus]MBK5046706.1 LysR family transcriptional regulator [Streptococcus sp. 2.1]MBK5077795.1 LysR family transcriptional regulator [Streptococcus sp. 22.1]MBK5162442.1 LysR family transcriptional regulator [Streptococcus sp. 3.1]MDU6911661.1 LysR family transcriptional regulator [Streptococcus salivarius]MTQ56528.1 LysR family transcriptional regulator [Streptococcus salivarius]